MDVLPSELARNLRDMPTPMEQRVKSRLRAKVAGRIYPVLHTWEGGFSIAAEGVVHLRGAVDLYDGHKLVRHCLIVASISASGELICEYKFSTLATNAPPADWAPDEMEPLHSDELVRLLA
ncbi:hypothetical protein [Haematobacter missouriensis]|nr:hypothetical protein [Haematobacter missouriensis]OWJ81632.1 hypothetical protein CDV52_16775 [Haematobacter missouriensis]